MAYYSRVLVFVLTVTMLSPLCFASGFLDGNDLLEDCSAVNEQSANFSSGVCNGYIAGISEMADTILNPGFICPSDNITARQLVRIVIKYLNDHPEQLHERKPKVVLRALVEAFPCKKLKDVKP
jgi:hypothetical protein